MPATKQVEVVVTALRKGDIIIEQPARVVSGKLLFNELPLTVAKVEPKTKYAIVTVADGDEQFTVEVTSQVRVEREVPTHDETVQYYVEQFVKALADCEGAEAKAISLFNEKVEKNGFQYCLSWGYAGDIVAARITERVAADALAIVEGHGAVEAARWIIEDATKRVVQGARGTSRSTSQWANLIEDVEVKAYADILDAWSGIGGYARMVIDADTGKYDKD